MSRSSYPFSDRRIFRRAAHSAAVRSRVLSSSFLSYRLRAQSMRHLARARLMARIGSATVTWPSYSAAHLSWRPCSRRRPESGAAYVLSALLGVPGLDEARGYLQQCLGTASLPEANARRILVAADAILRAGGRRPVEAVQ